GRSADRAALRALRCERARHAVPDSVREGPRADAGALSRDRGGPGGSGPAGAASSRADELSGGIRRRIRGRRAARSARGTAFRRSACMSRSGAARLLPPETLASLANLELVARTAVEGFLIGLHRSPRFGFSQEFAEYRAYVEGDDPRFVDWNVYARTERTYIRRYEGETNTRLFVLLDASASMGYSSGPVTKLQYGKFLA